MKTIPRFSPGDILSTSHIDGLSQAVKELQSNSINGVSGGAGKAGNWLHIPEHDRIRIQNNTNSACSIYEVLGIDGSYYDPATALSSFKQGEPILKGILPDINVHVGKFAVLLEPLPAGSVGAACICGVCQVQINVVDANDEYADVKDGSKILQSATTGSARILYKQPGTGTVWAIVRLCNGASDTIPSGSTASGSSSWESASAASESISEASSASASESESESESVSQSTSASESGSDKSTAIVPARFSTTGYAALFTLEAPEVRFDDVIDVKIRQNNQRIPIDPCYLIVCEPGSVRVCGVSCDYPVSVGASIRGGDVLVKFSRPAKRKISLVIRLTGIRKGFDGMRFPQRRREQFIANEKFINSAYPK